MAKEEQIERDLDDSEETEIELDSSSDSSESDVEVSEPDAFEKAESNTQKRIDRLTKKMREAQRREEEALRYAKSVQQEAEQLKTRFENLDTSYVHEYESRVTTQMDQAEQALARAMEIGDTAAAVAATATRPRSPVRRPPAGSRSRAERSIDETGFVPTEVRIPLAAINATKSSSVATSCTLSAASVITLPAPS